MGRKVFHQEKDLGIICTEQTKKFSFVAKNLEALETLFSLTPTDEIYLEGEGEMTYEQFKNDYLRNLLSIQIYFGI